MAEFISTKYLMDTLQTSPSPSYFSGTTVNELQDMTNPSLSMMQCSFLSPLFGRRILI